MTDYGFAMRQKFIQQALNDQLSMTGRPSVLGYSIGSLANDYARNASPLKLMTLDAKRAALRIRMHAEGRFFIGEETLAKQHNGLIFNPIKGWVKP